MSLSRRLKRLLDRWLPEQDPPQPTPPVRPLHYIPGPEPPAPVDPDLVKKAWLEILDIDAGGIVVDDLQRTLWLMAMETCPEYHATIEARRLWQERHDAKKAFLAEWLQSIALAVAPPESEEEQHGPIDAPSSVGFGDTYEPTAAPAS